jgi:hypothetical protein
MKRTLLRATAILLGLLPPAAGRGSPAVAPPATVAGVVRDAETAEILPGAVVTLIDLDRATATDSDGRYTLHQVPPGSQAIQVRSLGYAPRTLVALVPPAGELEIHVALHPEPVLMPQLEVRSPVIMRGAEPGDTVAFPDRECSAAAIRNHPLLSEPDAFQALGGGEVVLRPESPSGIHIRGGSTDQTAYLLDGIPAFNPYHAAGLTSAWNPDALSRLEVRSSTPALASFHALAGTIAGVTRTPGSRLSAQGTLSTSQARLTVDGPLGATGAGYLVSLRSGFHDALAPADEASYMQGASRDWIAKVEAPAFGGRMRLLGYDSQNDFDTEVAANTDGGPSDRNAFEWQSQSFGAEWRREFGTTTFVARGFGAGAEAESRWATKGAILGLEAERHDRGLATALEHRTSHAVSGVELRVEQSRTAYAIASDSTAVPPFNLSAHTPVVTLLPQHARAIHPDVHLKLGASLALAADEWYVGPGAELAWTVTRKWTLSGSFARSHQFSQSLRNAESMVGNVFPVDLAIGAGAPGVPVARSDQGVIACEVHPAPGVRLGLQAYQRAADDLLLVAPRVGEPFTPSAFTLGSGSARGLAAEMAVSRPRYGVVGSYGFQRVRLHYDDTSYVPEHGPTHLLAGGLTVRATRSLSARLGAVAELGRRTTPVAGGLEWEACNLLDQGCEFGGSPYQGNGPLGGVALPAYFRLDLGVRKAWSLRPGDRTAEVALFGTLTNLLGRKNLLTYAREAETGRLVGVEMRPPSPLVVGLDWRF